MSAFEHLPDGEDPRVEVFTRPLRASLTECWDRATALREIQSALDNSGFSADQRAGTHIRTVEVPTAKCTTIYEDVGGGIDITVRGPA
jgi:hypothetical protein